MHFYFTTRLINVWIFAPEILQQNWGRQAAAGRLAGRLASKSEGKQERIECIFLQHTFLFKHCCCHFSTWKAGEKLSLHPSEVNQMCFNFFFPEKNAESQKIYFLGREQNTIYRAKESCKKLLKSFKICVNCRK